MNKSIPKKMITSKTNLSKSESTVSNPNIRHITMSIAQTLVAQMEIDVQKAIDIGPKSALYVFNEEQYILQNYSKVNKELLQKLMTEIPDHEEVALYME